MNDTTTTSPTSPPAAPPSTAAADDIDIDLYDHNVYSYPIHSNPAWSDVQPIPQLDTEQPHVNHIVTIQYPLKYIELCNYLRACLANNEISIRVFVLTGEIIDLNSSYYTAWYYRRKCLTEIETLRYNLLHEMEWLNALALQSAKNYQLWQHRRNLVKLLTSQSSRPHPHPHPHMIYDLNNELNHTAQVLALDAKNYHAWSHRQWLLFTYKYIDAAAAAAAAVDADVDADVDSSDATTTIYSQHLESHNELDYIDQLLHHDLRNNSVWNARYYTIVHTSGYTAEVIQRELEYTFQFIQLAVSNESPYNYINCIIHHHNNAGEGVASTSTSQHSATALQSSHLQYIISKCQQVMKRYAEAADKSPTDDANENESIICQNALQLLIECYQMIHQYHNAIDEAHVLAYEYDSLRQDYWLYKIESLRELERIHGHTARQQQSA